MAQYKHDPIDLDGPGFRLLCLHRGNGSEISCELFQAWLHQRDDAISYEALSYTWGTVDFSESIVVNGRRLGVTLNLYLALQQLRYQDRDRILWVDAVCVDQSNKRERGHQVQQMGEIFKQADRVIFWLGPGTYETNVFIKSMQLLQQESIRHPCRTWKREDQRWMGLWEKVQSKLRDSHIDLVELENLQRQGLQTLLDRSWFRRVWILQEVANANAALVCCGAKSVPARFFGLAPAILNISPNAHCQAVLDIMPGSWRETSWWSQSHDLYTLFMKFGGSEATESRDLIYALTGMSSDAKNASLLRPNYERSEERLVRDAIQFMFYCNLDCREIESSEPATIRQLADRRGSLNYMSCLELAKRSQKTNMEMLLGRPDVEFDHKVIETAVLNDSTGEVTELLLQYRGNEIKVDQGIITTAVSKSLGAKNVTEVLLRLRGHQVAITEEVLIAAVRNRHCRGVMEVLLGLPGDRIFITEKVLIVAASNGRPEVMELLLRFLPRDQVSITENVLIAAASNQLLEVMELLLRFLPRDQVSITEHVLIATAQNMNCGDEMMEVLLRLQGDRIFVTENVLETATNNTCCGGKLMELFLQLRKESLDATKLAEVAAGYGEKAEAMIKILFQRRGQDIIVTETLLTNASRNGSCGKRVLEFLFQHRPDDVTITEDMIEAAIGNKESGAELLKLFIHYRPHDLKITSKSIDAALASEKCGTDAMEMLLQHQAAMGLQTTEEEFITFVCSSNKYMLKLFLQYRGRHGLTITRQVVQAAAENVWNTSMMMVILLQYREHDVKVEEDAAVELVKRFPIRMADTLIRYRRGQFIGNELIMREILDRFSSETNALNIAAANGNEGIVRILLTHGSNVEARDAYGRTPLACVAGQRRGLLFNKGRVASLLLEQGADIEATDDVGRTPLIIAADGGNLDVVRLLLENGADMEAADRNGHTSLTRATNNGYVMVVELLQGHYCHERRTPQLAQCEDELRIATLHFADASLRGRVT